MEEIRKYFDPFLKGAQGGSVSGTGNQEGFSPGAGSGKGADVDMVPVQVRAPERLQVRT